ncbi:MAG: hypothetical protein IPL08_14270 [Saprospiraceae bacterium]|nr:hypothetical protein [Saprospiraceae bacterium]
MSEDGVTPCDPTRPPLPAVTEFLEQNKSNFAPSLETVLQQLKQDATLKLQNLNCETFRSQVNATLNQGQFQSTNYIVKGNNSEYVNPGLSSEFNAPLKAPEYFDSDKCSDIRDLEINHAKLFECDLKGARYQKIIAKINDILANQVRKDSLVEVIKLKIKRWNEEDIAKCGDITSQAYKDWLKKQLQDIIADMLNDAGLWAVGDIQHKRQNPFHIRNTINTVDYVDYYNSIASIDDHFDYLQDDEKKEIAFYLENNFNSIKGIDRVHYLEAMSKGLSVNGTNLPNVMPLTISKSAGSMIYTVYLDQFIFTENSAQFNACVKIEDTQSGKNISLQS